MPGGHVDLEGVAKPIAGDLEDIVVQTSGGRHGRGTAQGQEFLGRDLVEGLGALTGEADQERVGSRGICLGGDRLTFRQSRGRYLLP